MIGMAVFHRLVIQCRLFICSHRLTCSGFGVSFSQYKWSVVPRIQHVPDGSKPGLQVSPRTHRPITQSPKSATPPPIDLANTLLMGKWYDLWWAYNLFLNRTHHLNRVCRIVANGLTTFAIGLRLFKLQCNLSNRRFNLHFDRIASRCSRFYADK